MAAPALQQFQRDFFAALFAADASSAGPAAARQPGFDIYRNTVVVGCLDALAANYPSVAELVGDEWFRNAARLFVREHLPSEGGLAGYGAGFADFLAGFAPARELPYLPAVARLDRFWTEAHLAADAPVLEAAALAALAPEALGALVVVPHPAARWANFPDLPAYTIWRRHRERLPIDDEIDWHGESALIVRPQAGVDWHALGAAGVAFLDACGRGAAFAAALDAAEAAEPGATERLAGWLPALFAAGAFTRIEGANR